MEKISFQIATPCHESWDKMSPETQGRFCDACQKCVVDLTDKKPAEIKTLYDAHQGDMCGRVRVSQLTRKPRVAMPRIQFPMNGLRRLQRFALALLFAGGFLFCMPAQAIAQGQVEVRMGKIAPAPENHVSGVVRWEGGKRVDGATVTLSDMDGYTLATTTTNSKGEYSFDGRWYGDLYLSASHGRGYGGAEVRFGHGTLLKKDIALIEETILMGDVMYVPEEEAAVSAEPREVVEFSKCCDDLEDDIQDLLVHGNLLTEGNSPEGGAEVPMEAQVALVEPGNKTHVELDGFGVTVYPNPANDRVFVTAASFSDAEVTITVTDMEGRVMARQAWKPTLQPIQMIPIQGYSPGVYLITVTDINGLGRSTRIVKQ